ncbi:MAG: hypothetical protein JSU58_01790 [Dehalococcoidales bacterium]|nr:MAG: hypothetical protein JSU58_01790 [Dehalococcoidales bacterium]
MSDTNQYEVLNPWAESDPVPMKGISPRLDTLDGKTIGLFQNFKQASKQMTKTIDRKLHERYPGINTVLFDSTDQNVNVIETDLKDEFIKWAEGIDAAILLVGN